MPVKQLDELELPAVMRPQQGGEIEYQVVSSGASSFGLFFYGPWKKINGCVVNFFYLPLMFCVHNINIKSHIRIGREVPRGSRWRLGGHTS
jgi:hypothetical protein